MSCVPSIEFENRQASAPRQAQAVRAFAWKRFVIQSLIAMALFNVLAGLVTWYIIFPRLFPAAG